MSAFSFLVGPIIPRVEALDPFTGQVGYAWNNVLWYLKGGPAVTDDKYLPSATQERRRDRPGQTIAIQAGCAGRHICMPFVKKGRSR